MRIYLIIAVLALALSGSLYGLWDTRSTLSATRTHLNEQALQIDALRASQRSIQVAVTGVQRLSAKTQSATKLSVDAAPEFRDTGVPPGVSDSLCKRLNCAK